MKHFALRPEENCKNGKRASGKCAVKFISLYIDSPLNLNIRMYELLKGILKAKWHIFPCGICVRTHFATDNTQIQTNVQSFIRVHAPKFAIRCDSEVYIRNISLNTRVLIKCVEKLRPCNPTQAPI